MEDEIDWYNDEIARLLERNNGPYADAAEKEANKPLISGHRENLALENAAKTALDAELAALDA